MVKSTILIRTYYKDFPWLHFCLRSIKKFCTGFDVKIVVPRVRTEALQNIEASLFENIHYYDFVPNKGMMTAMNAALDADLICPDSDYIFFLDCDCIFTKPVTPADYFHNGLIVLPVVPFSELAKSADEGERMRATLWPSTVEVAIGWKPFMSTMCRMPVIHHRSVFSATRAMIQTHTGKRPLDYLLSFDNEFPWKFSEFETIGAIADTSPLYQEVGPDYDPRIPFGLHSAKFKNVNCYWSHSGITQQVRAEMEYILQ